MIGFIGAYAYAREALHAILAQGHAPVVMTAPPGAPRWQRLDDIGWQFEIDIPIVARYEDLARYRPELVIVAGWRRIIPAEFIALVPRGVVGFHSARLPEYPGRAPVPWALVRGDEVTANTMLYIDAGVDTGDIIAIDPIPIAPGETPDTLYAKMAASSSRLIARHLRGLLDGTAPRVRQDLSRRGPLTTADGWRAWEELERRP